MCEKNQILEGKIEELRQKMHSSVSLDAKKLNTEKTYLLSTQLDKLLMEYYRQQN